MRHFLIYILVIGSVCIAGCGGTTQQVIRYPDQTRIVEEQSKGRIYVIGSPTVMNLASNFVTVTIVADQEWVGDIVGRSYLCWEREPGIATINTRRIASDPLRLSIESGKVYYIAAYIRPVFGSDNLRVRLEQLEEKEGKEQLLKSAAPEKIK
jgi:hypothetical protein